MITATKEHGEYTLFHLVNSLVWEARRNEEIEEKYGQEGVPNFSLNTERLLESLSKQCPNRIYFSPDGRICRVLLFSENERRFQARLETLRLQPNPEIQRKEVFAAGTAAYLEDEIRWWRKQFGMSGDLIFNPKIILKSMTEEDTFVHLGETAQGPIYCRYYLSIANGPRLIDLGVGEDYKVRTDEQFAVVDQPAEIMFRYANPFVEPYPNQVFPATPTP